MSLKKLLVEQIKDLYSAENQIIKALPKMIKAASSQELKDALKSHLEETKDQVERLEQICKLLDCTPKGKKCNGMKGLLEEGEEMIKEDKFEGELKDIGLIGDAQRVEHYEIAGYGFARSLAERLDEQEIIKILQETLDEEGEADKKLTEVCESLGLVEV